MSIPALMKLSPCDLTYIVKSIYVLYMMITDGLSRILLDVCEGEGVLIQEGSEIQQCLPTRCFLPLEDGEIEIATKSRARITMI
jgi:hypothetical protein